MLIKHWLKAAEEKLTIAGIATARLDGLVLLRDGINKSKAWLLAHPEFDLSNELIKKLNKQIERRAKHEPLAYIRGKSEFYGREFLVSPDTLQPRPETETMIDLLLKTVDSLQLTVDSELQIVDVGTGSGAIAITAKLELPKLEVHATEINVDALKIAKQNAEKLQANIKFYQGDLVEPLANIKIDVILANLPYVPDGHTINKAAMQEPAIAIFGGKDGLDLYRGLFTRFTGLNIRPKLVLTESLPFQHNVLKKIARQNGYKLIGTDDFIQVYSA